MATLRKKPRSPYWFACFTLPDGRRTQRSTKEKKRTEAQKKADSWEKLSKDRAKAKQAQIVIADIYRAAHKEELPDSTPRAFIKGWLARRKGEIAPSTYTAYEGRTKHFLAWLAGQADRPLGELETKTFTAYRNALAERLSRTTANQGIRILSGIFEDARKDGFMADNPAEDCEALLERKARGPKRRSFTLEELQKILSVADEEWRSMIYFGLYTGQRLKDIALLTWANVDLLTNEISFRTGKTNRQMLIPICGPLQTRIESLPGSDNPQAPLFPRMASSSKGSTLSRQFGEMLSAAGLMPKRKHEAEETEKKGRDSRRAVSEISFHSLRHTATSMMKNAGISPAIVQDIIGHDSAEINTHYTHIESKAKREALNEMPDISNP